MFRLGIVFAFAAAAFGQLTTDVLSKAPPAIDDALRARVKEFYQYHIDGAANPGKLRAAEQFVAEDSKDLFYASDKPKCVEYELKNVEYSHEFTRAKVTGICSMYMMVPGWAGKLFPAPMPSYWKVVDGKWFWYVDREAANKTPFGTMKPGGAPAQTASLPSLPDPETAMRTMGRGVTADRDTVQMDRSKAGSAQVTIANQKPGPVHLTLSAPKLDGLEILLDKTEIPASGQAVITVRYTPGKSDPPALLQAAVDVRETATALPIYIKFPK